MAEYALEHGTSVTVVGEHSQHDDEIPDIFGDVPPVGEYVLSTRRPDTVGGPT